MDEKIVMTYRGERKEWIDIAKGIGILLVVFGHSIGYLDDAGNRFILSFHMPLFFFLSGLCARRSNGEFVPFLKKKVRTLLVPQMLLGIINCLSIIVFFPWKELDVIKMFTGWYLIVQFEVVVCFYFLSAIPIFNKKYFRVVFMLACVSVSALLQWTGIQTYLYFEIVPMAMLFYCAGFYVREPRTNCVCGGGYL